MCTNVQLMKRWLCPFFCWCHYPKRAQLHKQGSRLQPFNHILWPLALTINCLIHFLSTYTVVVAAQCVWYSTRITPSTSRRGRGSEMAPGHEVERWPVAYKNAAQWRFSYIEMSITQTYWCAFRPPWTCPYKSAITLSQLVENPVCSVVRTVPLCHPHESSLDWLDLTFYQLMVFIISGFRWCCSPLWKMTLLQRCLFL